MVNATVNETEQLTADSLKNLSSKFINEVQAGDISEALNTTVGEVMIAEPLPDPSDDDYDEAINTEDNPEVPLLVPTSLAVQIQPGNGHETASFTTQPKLRSLDAQVISYFIVFVV